MNRKLKKMLTWTLGTLATLVVIWAAYTHFYEGNLGPASHTVLAEEGPVEYRRYAPFIIASTQMEQQGRSRSEQRIPHSRRLYLWGNARENHSR